MGSSAFVTAARALASGVIYRGPLGTVLPANDSSALNAALKSLGLAGDGGISEAPSQSTETFRDMNGDVVKVGQTESGLQFTFPLIEYYNPDVQEEIYGAGKVTTTPATTSAGRKMAVAVDLAPRRHGVWVFELEDGPKRGRHVVPDGQIIEIDEIAHQPGELSIFACTLETFKDTSGAYKYHYLDDGIRAVA